MGDEVQGRGIVLASWVGTAVFALVSIVATIAPKQFATAAAIVDLVLFFGGTAAFLGAYFIAVARSRTDAIGIGGLFFLQGSADRADQVRLLVPVALQVTLALITASLRIYSPLAFGILVPMYGLGLSGLWGARHGRFDARFVAAPDADA